MGKRLFGGKNSKGSKISGKKSGNQDGEGSDGGGSSSKGSTTKPKSGGFWRSNKNKSGGQEKTDKKIDR